MRELPGKFLAHMARGQVEVSRQIFEKEGLAGLATAKLLEANVEPVYSHPQNPELETMRQALNSRPGLIIGNHPGPMVDTLAILKLLSRRDVKFMVSPWMFKSFQAVMDKDYLLQVSSKDGGSDLWPSFRKAADHIKGGGAVLLYPGGPDRNENAPLTFEKGFGVLKNQLRPDDMVYCFNFNENDMGEIRDKKPDLLLGFALENVGFPGANINKMRKPFRPRVDERLTSVADWPADSDPALQTDYFLNLFKNQQS